MQRRNRTLQLGTTLVEALMTFLVLSLGLMAVSKVQGQLRLAGENARQRSEAVRLAQEDIEQLRAFSSMAAAGGAAVRSFADIVDARRSVDSASGFASNTRYTLQRRVGTSTVPSARDISVAVSWSDRAGATQQVTLESVIGGNDPALSGALGVAPASAAVKGPLGRAVGIPRVARDLGDGRSAFGPLDGAPIAFVVDNASGLVENRCAGAAASIRTAADLSGCTQVTAYLLTGVVRFAPGPSGDMVGPVLRATVLLHTSGSTYPSGPECSTTPVAATDGDRYLQYVCIVYPRGDGRWSGEADLIPDGWAFGTGRSGHRICAEGAKAAPAGVAAGPASTGALARYTDVTGTLANQNFRIVRGDVACPA